MGKGGGSGGGEGMFREGAYCVIVLAWSGVSGYALKYIFLR